MAGTKSLILPGASEKRSNAESLLCLWLQKCVDLDGASGRRMEDFGVPLVVIAKAAEAVERSGAKVVVGAGNVFHVRWRGDIPIVVQNRPFASRIVRIKQTEETTL